MLIVDSFGMPIDTNQVEKPEQDLANKYIQPSDIVLELGARYGSVSCVINKKLQNKTHQVVVEPDERVWDALERNKQFNDCHFSIVKGFISNQSLGLTNLESDYGTTCEPTPFTQIPSYSLNHIMQTYGLCFNVLVADCEGFLEIFFDENPNFYKQLRLIIFEADYPEKCNYTKIEAALAANGFKKMLKGHQNVWMQTKECIR